MSDAMFELGTQVCLDSECRMSGKCYGSLNCNPAKRGEYVAALISSEREKVRKSAYENAALVVRMLADGLSEPKDDLEVLLNNSVRLVLKTASDTIEEVGASSPKAAPTSVMEEK